MGYVVIESFTDMSDNYHEYRAGDVYPRYGINVSDGRIAELSGPKNRLKRPLIRLENNKPKDYRVEEKKAAESLSEPKKRTRKNRKRENE